MPYFKDTNNNVHFLESSDYVHLLPCGCVEISQEDAETLQPIPIIAQPTQTKLELLAQVEALLAQVEALK